MKKISKRKCYEIAKEFCDLEDDYLMGIIYNNGNIEIGMVISDLLKSKKVLYRYDTFLSKPSKRMLAEHIYRIIENECKES
jgi:hypothetical protein